MYFDGGASPNSDPMLSRVVQGANALLRDLDVSKRGNDENAGERTV